MTEPAKLPLTTPDLKTGQIEKLRQLFPEVFTEGGKLDFDRLRATLGDIVDDGPERFGLTWPGKRDCFRLIQEPSTGTLLPVEEESVNWDTTQNLFIEADNLEALKLLQKSYYGKVKMIYIDPPYNTGKDFIYPDRYAENLQTYLAYTGQASDEGYRFSTNPDTDGRFHSRWLNMMYPRLFLARNLLRDDGVIFVSIGDVEIDNLKKICNEIYGEENFIACISRVMKKGGQKGVHFSPCVDYILVYAKNIVALDKFRVEISKNVINKVYTKIAVGGDRDGEKYRTQGLYQAMLDKRPNQRYYIQCPDGSLVIPPGYTYPPLEKEGEQVTPNDEDGVWRWTYDTYKSEKIKGNVEFIESDKTSLVTPDGSPSKWNVYKRIWLEDRLNEGQLPGNILERFESRHSSAELKELNIPFDFAKPKNLIQYLMAIIGVENEDIVLDFFSGSGTTAHAAIDFSLESGLCKFICVQLPELNETESEEFKAGFKTIADIGKERIRRVIQRIQNEAKDLEGKIKALQGTLKTLDEEEGKLKEEAPAELFGEAKPTKEMAKIQKQREKAQEELEQAQEQLENIRQCDLGFRVFRLGESNFKVWDGDLEKEDLGKQLEMALEYIRPERSEQDMLFELLIKSGFPLTTPVERLTLAGKTVWSVAEVSMLVCLERPLTQEVIRAMAAKEPPRVVVLDAGFQDNDPLKTNAVQIMRSHGVEDFRTV